MCTIRWMQVRLSWVAWVTIRRVLVHDNLQQRRDGTRHIATRMIYCSEHRVGKHRPGQNPRWRLVQ